MPIYEYICAKCGNEFELLVKSSSEKVGCPKCSNSKIDRKLSVFSASVSAGSSKPACGMVESCPSAGKSCCSGGTCGQHRH
ncbi:MAG TPA: transcriptional regulator [Lentisphaeria bacterium]|nr:MAG: hypothetical protein A2X45_10680 [Lentisphaerae bacterium GWF2_50_93]HCE41994.1 transcriptional regulator [Lentisphaeria bacterium]